MNTVTVLGYVQVMAIYIGMLLIGQGAVYLLSFGKHESNAIYKLFAMVTSPVVKIVRMITPSQVTDKHLPFVGFFLVFWIAFGLAVFIPTLVPTAMPK
jgi:uncharacterized protein YggT (Ycf19 family)